MKNDVLQLRPCRFVLGVCHFVIVPWFLFGIGETVRADSVLTTCEETGLRAALLSGGVVKFACDGTIALSRPLVISTNAILDATERNVTLDGERAVGVFVVQTNVQFTVVGVRVTQGHAELGGGLSSTNARVELRNCTFQTNQAVGNEPARQSAAGGAIYCVGGEIVAINSQFVENAATLGNASGGAIATVSCLARFQNCGFERNEALASSGGGWASGGAAAELGAGTFEFQQCTFRDNQAVGGAGFRSSPAGAARGGAVFSQSPFLAENCTFTGNGAAGGGGGSFYGGDASGGALYIGGTSALQNCLFLTNRASAGNGVTSSAPGDAHSGDGEGGSIFNSGNLQGTGCSFAWNRVDAPDIGAFLAPGLGKSFGAAVYSSGDCALTNSTCFQNWSVPQLIRYPPPLANIEGTASGAALYQVSNRLALTHCTIVSNAILSTHITGAAVHITVNSVAQLSGCIFAGNTNMAVIGAIKDEGGNLSSEASGPFVNPNSHTNVDLRLGSFGYHGGFTPLLALLPNSPAIDVIDAALGVMTDQRGVPRPIGPRFDAGAFEYLPPPVFHFDIDGSVQIDRVLQPRHEYRFERSGDLTNWTVLSTATSDDQGRVQIKDSSAAGQRARYYRVLIK